MSNSQLTYRFSVNPQGELPAAGNGDPVNSDSSLCLDDRYPDSLGADLLSIALIGPDEERRKAAAAALAGCQAGDVREFASYPASLDDVPMLLEQHYDVIAIDLDSNPEYALELVESICADGSATVMVYSVKTDLELPVRCMRAGAREFLTLPFAQSTMAEALIRVSARRRATRLPKKAGGRLLVFLGAKAGEGVTTIACNYAVALALESGQSTLLIDLNLPLGDAALNLGVVAEFSAINALQNFSRLDSSFLSKLLVKHSSGVSVLAAPGKFPQFEASNEAIDKLLAVAQQDFENVVVDVGSKLDFMGTALFKDGSTIYLVIQAGIAGLRNANRLISQYFTTRVPKLEIVINRFQPRSLGVAEDEITKALTRPVQWKIPNDYAAVRRMQHTAIPFALEDSPISRLIRQMARSACGLPTTPEKEKGTGFSLKSFSRSISARISTPEEAPAITQPGLAPGQDNAGAASGATQPDATANIPGNSVYTPPAGALLATETQTSFTPTETADRTGLADAKWEALPSAGAPDQEGEPETRAYKGATYVKGADGEWRLQQIQATVVNQETPAIAWPEPAPIAYGAALSATELNAAASVPGTFAYTPAAGEVLAAGTHTLRVTFTPADSNLPTAQVAVSLTVTEATPAIAWPMPAPIAYGAALSATELNAAASVPGTFAYTPAAGEVLAAGTHMIRVTFTPADAAGYTTAQAAVSLTVTRAKPAIAWPMPAPIAYGAALSATELNATASVPGTFVYIPAEGAVLAAGTHKPSVIFIPADTANYTRAQVAVSLTVTEATPVIAWPEPAPIAYGAALSATELNAAASVPGTFVYTPATGEVLAAGTYMLSVTFTPADAANYTTAQAAVSLAVTEATPAIAWPEPAPIAHGAALSATDLDAESQPAPAKAAPAQAEKPPAPQAKPAPRKAPAKAPAKPPVKADAEPPFEPPAKAPVENPAPESPVDVVSGLDLMGTAVFKDGTTIYLVMQPGAAGVDNANRLVSQYFTAGGPKPEVVIKRFESRLLGGAEDQTTTALVRSAHSPISRLIRQMARSASDLPATPEKEKMTGFSLKGFSRSIRAKISSAGKAQAITRLGLWSDQDNAGAAPGATQPDATANIPGNTVYTPPVGTVLAAEPQTPFTPTDIEDRAGAPDRQGEPETRNYKGATYVKGADGEWHLQETQTSEVNKETPAIAWPMPAPIADDTALSATELNAESQPAPAKAAPAQARKPAPQAKPAPRKAPAKAAAKPQAKAPARPPVKPPAKAATKPPAKAPAKPPVKTPAKAPAPKSAHAKGKPAPAANSKAGRVSHAAKPSKPAAKKPAPRPAKKR
jgi:pilus assembly protein CpaE